MLGIHPNVYETKEKYKTVDPDLTLVENDIWRSVEMSHNDTEEADTHKTTNTKIVDMTESVVEQGPSEILRKE